MRTKPLVDALFPKTRQAVLAATLMHPQRWWFLADLARYIGVTPSSLQREMVSLVQAGILLRRQEGKQVYFRPDPSCPILGELQGIMTKTAGLVDVLSMPFPRLPAPSRLPLSTVQSPGPRSFRKATWI